ncbi:MAG: toxin TcdB middle/N-terminal domain-containing protein, partial [Desulfococcaceae bacterium]|nr:toxin TcdB middle/N-terminal domain-containing protein [Desulfococcaceae bacterium]
SVTQVGDDGIRTLPPAEFTYTQFDPAKKKIIAIRNTDNEPAVHMANEADAAFNDMNADGLPDLLIAKSGAHEVFLNRGIGSDGIQRWGQRAELPVSPGNALGSRGASLADITGDGKTDFIAWQSYDTYFVWPNLGNGQWGNAETFADKSNFPFDFEDEAVRLIDIDNDRHTDVMYCNGPDLYSYFINNKGKEYSPVLEKPGLGMTFDTEPGMKLADMNGDLLQDIVLLKDGICTWWPSMGRGNWDAPQNMNNSPDSGQIPSLYADWEKLMLMDINGDGLSDIVYAPVNADKIHYWLNRNTRDFDGPFEINDVPLRLDNTNVQPADMNGNGTTDFLWNYPEEAEGNPDKIWQYLELCPDEKPNLLKTVTNGIGKTITFHYSDTTREQIRDREAGKEWKQGVPTPVTLLSAYDVADGRGSLYQTAFAYHEGCYDGEEKEFRGFAHAEKQEIGDSTIPDLLMVYQFDTGAEKDALKGKPLHLSVKNLSGQEFYRESYVWQTRKLYAGAGGDLREVTFPFQEQKMQTVLEKGNGAPVSLKWEFSYDDFGNLTRQYEHGRTDDGWNDERITETVYTAAYPSGQTAWILNKAVESTVKDENGARASHQRSYFDNLPIGQVSKGNLTKTENRIGENRYAVTVRNDYDTYGNAVAVYDALYGVKPGHWREIIYDTEYHTFPLQEIIHTGDNALTVSATYDFGMGVMTSSTDFNGHTASYGYDTFGRLIHIIKPPDTGHTVEYDYVLARDIGGGRRMNWVETRQRDNSAGDGFLHSRTFYDGLGRKIMTRSEGEEAGQVVVSDTVQFNARKQPWKSYLPYFENATLDFAEPSFNTGFSESFYDATGRAIRVNQPVGPDGILFSTTEYQPLVRIIRDEEQTRPASPHFGCGMKYAEDGLLDKEGKGRLREVCEIVRLSDTGESLPGTVSWKTAYEYDLLDKLVKISDSQNNQKFMAYDGLGRKTFMNDPDRGTMAYEYDDAGNLIQTTDAKNQVIRYEYDGINRLIAEYYGESKTLPDVAYHYDTPYGPVEKGAFWNACSAARIQDAVLQEDNTLTDCDLNHDGRLDAADAVKAARSNEETVTAQNLKGFLSWVKDASGEEHNSYDARGRVEWVVKRIAGNSGLQNFYTAMEYDAMDRVTKLIYPDQSHVSYSYNSRGLLESVPGIINQYDFNPSGQNALLALACGTQTRYTYDHRLRLSTLQTQRQTDSLFLQDLSYSFDGVSNITGIQDGRSGAVLSSIGSELGMNADEAGKFNATQAFAYDSLYRLTRAQNPDVYGSISYRYDRIGNMIAKNAALNEPDVLMNLGGMSSGGTAGTFGRIGRNAGDPPGPHAITATEKGPDGAMTFTYDANGNMTTDRGMSLAWDAKDRLEGIRKGVMKADYSYDYTDTRKRKYVSNEDSGQQSEVLYVDKFSEVREGKLLKYVYAGNSRIASAKSTGAKPGDLSPETFYLHDHLGSTALTLSQNGSVQEQMVNYPFGMPRLEKRAGGMFSGADYKFTGKERDVESGLQYFEARYYNS